MSSKVKRFKEKVVIITGAAGGIGFEIARAFISEGAYTVLVDSSEKVLDIFNHADNQSKSSQLIFKTDLTDINEINKVVSKTIKSWGKIDILINTVGVNVRKNIDQYTEEDFENLPKREGWVKKDPCDRRI